MEEIERSKDMAEKAKETVLLTEGDAYFDRNIRSKGGKKFLSL